jgi:hypothetical protein
VSAELRTALIEWRDALLALRESSTAQRATSRCYERRRLAEGNLLALAQQLPETA